MIFRSRSFQLLLGLALPLNVFAWGATGHQVVAMLAAMQLTAEAQAQVQTLLDLEPGSTFVSISTWADERKTPTTSRWHFVNFPRNSCTYEAQRDCPDGSCIVGAIQRQLDTLRANADGPRKLAALKYLVHFLGDIHQPLHAGYADDAGGNKYQLQVFMRGTNLHAFWDSGLLKATSDDPEFWVAKLALGERPERARITDPVEIAEEACNIVATRGFYPGKKVDEEYALRWGPILASQLTLAGARLAAMLNGIFTKRE